MNHARESIFFIIIFLHTRNKNGFPQSTTPRKQISSQPAETQNSLYSQSSPKTRKRTIPHIFSDFWIKVYYTQAIFRTSIKPIDHIICIIILISYSSNIHQHKYQRFSDCSILFVIFS